MSTATPNMGLFKYDPATDGASTFNIDQALNDNWDAIDEAMPKKADLVGGKVPAAQLPDMDYVPTSRTVNGKALSSNISLTAADVGADGSGTAAAAVAAHAGDTNNPHGVTTTQIGAVPTTRTINGKALSANISLTASDVGAASTTDLSNLIVVGSYTGNGAATRTISLGFTPRAVIVYSRYMDQSFWEYGGIATPSVPAQNSNGTYTTINIVSGGFNVYYNSSAALERTNYNGYLYSYIAIK